MAENFFHPVSLLIFFVVFVLWITPFFTPLRNPRQKYPVLNIFYQKPVRWTSGVVSLSFPVLASAIYFASFAKLEAPMEPPPPPLSQQRDGSKEVEGVPPGTKAESPPELNGGEGKKYKTVSVFYGTDRNVTGQTQRDLFFGGGRGKMQFGICQVSVPEDHRIGALETPFILLRVIGLKKYAEDPEKHVILVSVEPKPKDIFLAELKKKIGQSERREAFVFIHGYNVSFEDACRRTGQIAYDLKFSGAPIMYSWPSDGKTANYFRDETDIEWSTPNFKEFLLMVAEKTGAQKVHLIAHSMGNRALVNALTSIVSGEDKSLQPLFNQVILTAPDIDAGVFRNLVQAVQKTSTRTTLYASSNDEALKASKKFHGYPRLGEAGPNLTVIDGMDSVDVSSVRTSLIGHSYFGDEESVITDLYELLTFLKPPKERFYLQAKSRNGLTYWEFRKRKGS